MPRSFLLLLASGAFASGLTLLAAARPGDPCTREGFSADPPRFASCTSCHTDFAVGEGDGSFAVHGVPAVWQPGATYRIRATLEDPGQVMWGFRITAIDASGADAGTMSPADPWSEPCFFNGRSYLRQTNAGTRAGVANGPVDWEIDWTAPAAGTGTVFFYAVGLSCDFSSSPSGDVTYSAAAATAELGAGREVSLVLQPDGSELVRGATWVVRVRVVNHGAGSGGFFFVSRVRLASGLTVPSSGSLEPPVAVTLQPATQADLTVPHAVPASAPLISATYEAWIGAPPATVVAASAIGFSILG